MVPGVLERNDSFACALGAKLSGQRLLRAVERSFESPIKINSPPVFSRPVTWLDVCLHAKKNPGEFFLTTLPDGSRCCQFMCKGVHAEISEDDWRFITSGVLDRIPLENPLPEDEAAEMATLDILEKRTMALWRRADEVSARSRLIHRRLGQRRAEIERRLHGQGESDASSAGPSTAPGAGPGPAPRFQPLDPPSRASSQHPTYDLHTDLLQQFAAASEPFAASRPPSGLGMYPGLMSPSIVAAHGHRVSISGRMSGNGLDLDRDRDSDVHRPLMTQKIDKLSRDDPIDPPCDRCRRLKVDCQKYLSACQGCTKKHAKCSWKMMTEDEAAALKREISGEESGAEAKTPERRPLDNPAAAPIVPADSASVRPESSGAIGAQDPPPPPGGAERNLLPSPIERVELPPMRMETEFSPLLPGIPLDMSRRSSQSTVSQPMAGQPVINQPTASQPVISQPVVGQPVVGQPVIGHPANSHPVNSHPANNHPANNHPVSSHLANGHPVGSQPAPGQSAVSQYRSLAHQFEMEQSPLTDGLRRRPLAPRPGGRIF